ncbi:hypothetical protein ACLB9Y_17565 [Chryseobacterium scophthalmum]|uniref:hypothetical protein n=1 Tax=Chryseobacterium scophthalmum TaxID=59733 RepID=UPI00398A7BB2
MKPLNKNFSQRFYLKSVYVIFSLISAFFITSCSNNDDDAPVTEPTPIVYPQENPLDKYYESTGFTTTTYFVASPTSEFGLAFSPNVKGKINAIFVKIPAVKSNLRVTIWDYDTKAVMRTEVVNVTTANNVITKNISEILLEKDKKYMITMNSGDWYKRAKPDNSNATYPITAGNIKFWEYRWVGTASQIFPTNIDLKYNGGDLSFSFQQTD